MALTATLFLAGCERQKILVYEVPHADPHEGHNHGPAEAATAHAPAMPAHDEVTYELPEGWVERGASGMRAASFAISGEGDQMAEVAIMPFKRMDELDFLNILRTSLGLMPVDASRLPEMTSPVPIGDETGQLFDVTQDAESGTKADTSHVLVAMLNRGDSSWFFKLAGDAELVDAQRVAFVDFLKTIGFKESASSPPATPSSTAAPPQPGLPQWSVPEGWKQVPPTTMLLAKFELSNEAGATASVTVSSFPGDVGGMLANINRWRSQVGLQPVGTTKLGDLIQPVEMADGVASVVDFDGEDGEGNPTRLIGAIDPHKGSTWFYKLMGAPEVAEAEKSAFIEFVKSIRHPDA